MSGALPPRERVASFAVLGLAAFTTTREAGSYGFTDDAPVGEVNDRWFALLRATGGRLASAHQVHGARVAVHQPGWDGWLRVDSADGHATAHHDTALVVTIADCVPVFIGHPKGPAALLHAGWRGVAAGVLDAGIQVLKAMGCHPRDLIVHLGPAICGSCYEVGPDVYAQLMRRTVDRPATVDLRALLADQARLAGAKQVETSPWCTRCHRDRFFSHRAGDGGRQVAVIAPAS
ncbi:MAG: polyphenol oxidase family protein [Gemmatimonadaceae bacterium]|nr:polyphenol oxidase family protein [Gemmatimonadaceae bacterium]